MADDAQLKLLKQGAKAWNKWRQANPEIAPDLGGADLSGADLSGVDLSEAHLDGVHLRGAHLDRADLGGADLSGADLREADLSGADLSRAHLDRADLRWADLSGAHLDGADLSEAHLDRANLRGAHLDRANLSGADLHEADLREADLRGADLSWADLREADLRGADLSSSDMANTELGTIDLRAVKGLETVQHLGPSTIGIDTIYLSKGNIPEVFLRGAGVPDDFITYMKSLAVSDYYSCFISYSSRDEDFAKRLYADLRTDHVRCWFAREHLKIGDKFRRRIDEAIRLYDKFLLILSENSVNSPWVETEVESAFEQERRQKRLVLFPIRLDDAVMETRQAWAAHIRQARQIGDFRHWKDHDSYKTAFARLLRDLKADDKAESASQTADA